MYMYIWIEYCMFFICFSIDWLKGDTASAIPLDPLVVKALKTFEYHCKFKNAVLELMIDQLSDDDIAKLRISFKSMDEDGSGTITIDGNI